jgi:hypothetical protein
LNSKLLTIDRFADSCWPCLHTFLKYALPKFPRF